MKPIAKIIQPQFPECEEWKPVFYDTTRLPYEVSNYGNVRRIVSANDKIYRPIKPVKVGKYLTASMSYQGVVIREYIHRLVAAAFIPIPIYLQEQGYTYSTLEVNHIMSGSKSKQLNIVTNLEWVTGSGNKRHDYNNGTRPRGEKSHLATKNSDIQIHMVCKLLEQNKLSVPEISRRTGVHVGAIYDVLRLGSWLHISRLYKISNYKPKNTKSFKYSKNDVISMYNSGKTLSDISKETGIKYGTVWYYIKHS